MNLIANRKFEQAIELIRLANPFPAVCGRVCTRPCEETCILSENGDPVSIRALKRYASDYELARRPLVSTPCEIIYSEKIAIIGAGPAGLTAAVDLIRMGYPVTVFEKENEPGGMLRYAIPPYRLPDRILKREIDWIKSLGIIIKTKIKIKDPPVLFKKGFSAILIAGGAPKSFPLGIKGENGKGVIDALKFLRDINEKKPIKIKGDVIVIGGGSTAFDAARSAVRLGAEKVTLAYRRGIEEMPADKEEIDAAKQEGVKILNLSIPKKILVKNGKVIGIELLKAKLGEIDESGRRKPDIIKNSEFTKKTDIIIPAIGAMPDIGPVGGVKVTTPKGVIDIAGYGKTVVDGVFAAGDVELGPSSVVDAIGRGHQAAKGINAYLRGTTVSKPEDIINTIQVYLKDRICSNNILISKKINKGKVDNFKEIEKTITDFEAVEEASRCFSCGPCYACPVCLPNCKNKQLVATIQNNDFLIKAPLELSEDITYKGAASVKIKVDNDIKSIKLHSLTAYVDKELCIGCGRCEEVCAYRAIKNVINKDQRTFAEVAHASCASCSACVSECPVGAISQGYMSDNNILFRFEKQKTPYDGIKALMSFWSTPSPIFGANEGVIELMSSRKPSPVFLIRALARTGRGLLVIRPDEITGSHYLPWEEHPDEVIQKTHDLLKFIGISPDRIQYKNLPKGKNPLILLKEFTKDLDKKNLKKMFIPIPDSINNPLGESISLLRIMSVNPDIAPFENIFSIPSVKKDGVAYFEGCLPLLHRIGEAQKLFNLEKTRTSIIKLFDKKKTNIGFINDLSCPSKGLLSIKKEGIKEIVNDISLKNIKSIKKTNPCKIIIATPEAYLSFSKEKDFGNKVLSLPDKLLKLFSKKTNLKKLNIVVALHKACTLENDLFYSSTKKLLSLIPGLKIVELNEKCGQDGFENLNGDAKQKTLNFMNKAKKKNADFIVCTSPYCLSHFLLCNREGSWQFSDIQIIDAYQLLLSSYEGDI